MKRLCLALALVVCISAVASSALPTATGGAEEIVITESGGYLFGLPERTTLATFKAIYGRADYTVANLDGVAFGDAEFMGTGFKVYYDEGDVGSKKTLEVVVVGDVDGNGKVTTTDYIAIKNQLVKGNLEGVKAVAADVDGFGISSTDYLKVKMHFSGSYDLYGGVVIPDVSDSDVSDTSDEYNEDPWTSGWN